MPIYTFKCDKCENEETKIVYINNERDLTNIKCSQTHVGPCKQLCNGFLKRKDQIELIAKTPDKWKV